MDVLTSDERYKLLALAYALDTRLARVERLLADLGAAIAGRRVAKPRRATTRRVSRELAYAHPAVGQVYRYNRGGEVGPSYLVTEVDAAQLRLRLIPGLWDPKRRALTAATVRNAERWVAFADLRGSYEFMGHDHGAAPTAQEDRR